MRLLPGLTLNVQTICRPARFVNVYAESVRDLIRRRRSLILAQGWSASDNPGTNT